MSASPFENAVRELSASAEDIRPSDVVLFSEPLRSSLNFVIRLGKFTLTDFENKLGLPREQAKQIADLLVKRNLFLLNAEHSTPAEPCYEARLTASSRPAMRKPADIWKKIDLG